ncbi:helix-turn-helix domain-containing protein [Actinomadura spongiicola]|uniref:Helix-turn-helix domain-containing protein n=1 Tax=Actinomadura spongiicola TaxID=2303421 RepID=A0A372GPL9_9ACTN|nr:helix-turn-helix domain-containing protein [Actinomadura spongiicola]RFS87326.1 helix-turn-helix domain-containing protein [Actinomadura spongiicola]
MKSGEPTSTASRPAETDADPSLGALLRWWRERALLTQEQLADRAGLNVRTIRRLENQELRKPRATSTLLLAEALGLTDEERAILAVASRGPSRVPPKGCGRRDLPVARNVPGRPSAGAELPTEWGRVLAGLTRNGEARQRAAISIEGMAGVGKTALAVHAAHRLAPRFPDGQLFVDLRGHSRKSAPVDPGAVLTRLLGALGVPEARVPRHVDDRAALYRDVLAYRRVLIVLDDAAGEEQVRPLLPGGGNSQAIVTGRRRISGLDHVWTVPLNVLPVYDAVTLFTCTAGADRIGDAPADVLTAIVERCGLLPLAVRVAALRLRTHSTWTTRHLLDRLNTDGPTGFQAGGESVAAALDLSYLRLPADQRRAYRVLGSQTSGDFGIAAATTLLEAPTARARWLLDRLMDAHLLMEPVPFRYRFHVLVREHASAVARRYPTDSVFANPPD